MNEGLDLEESKKRLLWYEKKYGPYIEARGLNNFKNLFRKPTLYEWTILFMLILTLLGAYAYNRDISVCHKFIEESIEREARINDIVNEELTKSQQPTFNQPIVNIGT